MSQGGAPSEAFPKALRLRSRAEFLKVQSRGQKIAAEPLLGLYLPNGLPHTRVGLTVSSKVGNSVVRNRIRRCLRECFRKKHHLLPAGVDVVLIARSGAASADFSELSRAFDAFCSKLKGRSAPPKGTAP